jgi:GNAT superfamily N-acetyltransferase
VATLAGLINRAYEIEKFFVEGDRISTAQVVELLSRGVFLIGEEDDAPAACVYIEIKADRGYFGLLSVDPARQGHGWGREMVEAAEQWRAPPAAAPWTSPSSICVPSCRRSITGWGTPKRGQPRLRINGPRSRATSC